MTLQVLIVGAGPTGLTLANELARQKINFRIIDKMATPSTLSKAIALQARSLELLERFPGLVESLLQQGLRLSGGKIFSEGRPLAQIDLTKIQSRYPFVLSLPQYDTENILREQLQHLGSIVEMQTELISVEQADDHVVARIRHHDGYEEVIQVEYLAACDGAHSVVRKQLNLSFKGSTFSDQRFMLADVTLNKEMPANIVQVFFKSGAIVACFPLSAVRFRFIVEQPKSGDVIKLEASDLQKLLQEMIESDIKIQETFWFSEFSINQRKVDQYQVGRIFLLGDAAHIHSPVGGQGMNTGMQDAINLGWKLSLVLKGLAKAPLLETYAAERSKVGEQLLRATDVATKIVTLKNKFAIAIRDFFMRHVTRVPKVQQRIANNMAELIVNYRGGPLSVEYTAKPSGIRAGDRWPDDVLGHERWYELLSCDVFNIVIVNGSASLIEALQPFQDKFKCFSSEMGSREAEIYVIRPDHYVAYHAMPVDIEKLVGYLHKL